MKKIPLIQNPKAIKCMIHFIFIRILKNYGQKTLKDKKKDSKPGVGDGGREDKTSRLIADASEKGEAVDNSRKLCEASLGGWGPLITLGRDGMG